MGDENVKEKKKKATTGRPPKAEALAEQAYMDIRRMLFLNEIAPGQKLNYRDLAEQLNMSPTPIIQALKRLEFQGLVRYETNRGFFMEPLSAEELAEIYRLREIIEVSLLPMVIQFLDKKGEAALRQSLEAHQKAMRTNYRRQRLLTGMQFHIVLAELSGSPITVRFLRNLFDLLYLKYKGDILFARPLITEPDEHQKIFERIKARDLEGARKVLSSHIRQLGEHVLNGFKASMEESETLQF
jgi:DNA-binding GntR family transcriptional regulator